MCGLGFVLICHLCDAITAGLFQLRSREVEQESG